MSPRQAARLAAEQSVASVEADQSVRITDTQTAAPWGLDTGITVTHLDFGGRASYGYDAVDGDNVAQDGNGHGTPSSRASRPAAPTASPRTRTSSATGF